MGEALIKYFDIRDLKNVYYGEYPNYIINQHTAVDVIYKIKFLRSFF